VVGKVNLLEVSLDLGKVCSPKARKPEIKINIQRT
jgi:hypothetical protein